MIVDLFAGGGGASVGIENALGRKVDIAINHDPDAIAMHKQNHPDTQHFKSDVFEVDPKKAVGKESVDLLWASPDCTYFSKSRGGKPIRVENKKRRALAWVVTRWAGQVKPRVIILENVEEFKDWGPLIAKRGKSNRVKLIEGGEADKGDVVPIQNQVLTPDPNRRGERFKQWVKSLTSKGYVVEYREISACDYGAPTIRNRLFVIARRDGNPIVWPEATHSPVNFKVANDCIDWSIPMCSIYSSPEESKEWAVRNKRRPPSRPLADNTMKRIEKGLDQYILNCDSPFKVEDETFAFLQAYYGTGVGQEMSTPMRTLTTKHRLGLVVVDMCEETRTVRDVFMRMLSPREIFRGQGFPETYVISKTEKGKLSKTAQVRLAGNSVCPPAAEALVRANYD